MSLKTKTNKERHKRTIAKELHNQWRKLERKNDPEKIATLLGVSKPTIDKALIYGCVHQQAIIEGINQYFTERINAEIDEATKLKELNQKDPS